MLVVGTAQKRKRAQKFPAPLIISKALKSLGRQALIIWECQIKTPVAASNELHSFLPT
jgi:hypothetical protein